MVILCSGMYRSGSTLIFNILREIVEENGLGLYMAYPSYTDIQSNKLIICKCHDLDPKWDVAKEEFWQQFKIIYSFRDIRDVLCSMCQ
ncbi:MAG: sulfotransferase, partial [Nanoarchaeota archaeon]